MKRLADVNLETSESLQINMSPLIDMVFLLLIFFMVTAVFVEETDIPIQRPAAASSTQAPADPIRITITADGSIHFDGTTLTPEAITPIVQRLTVQKESPVLVLADEAAPSGLLVKVVDAARLGGAASVSIATEKTGSGRN